jgi:SP family general alpha glucoside:H+ symporter-like MFS transporter
LGIVGTVVSWGLVSVAGRRTLFRNGLALLLTFLTIIGIISVLPLSKETNGFAVASLLLVFTFAFNCTVGPVAYSLVAELPSTRLKSKTINLARACYSLVGLFNGAVTPLMINPENANWGAKSAWFWAGITAFCLLYTQFCVPEPTGLTFGQIDHLYAEGVPARQFKKRGLELQAEEGENQAGNQSEGQPARLQRYATSNMSMRTPSIKTDNSSSNRISTHHHEIAHPPMRQRPHVSSNHDSKSSDALQVS